MFIKIKSKSSDLEQTLLSNKWNIRGKIAWGDGECNLPRIHFVTFGEGCEVLITFQKILIKYL